MKKKGIIILLTILIGVYLYWNNRYVQFYPVEFNGEKYIINKKNISSDFYNNLQNVLNYYGEKFNEQNGIIYVKSNLFNDKELSYNYTKKAIDTVWLLEKRQSPKKSNSSK